MQEGVDDRRRRADVLALAAGHLVAQQDRDGAQLVQRELLEDDLLDLQLVLGVLGGVGQRDHDRLGARVDELTHDVSDVLRVEPRDDLPGRVDALPDRADQASGDERLGALGGRQVLLHRGVESLAVTATAGQRDGVLETVGDDGAHLRALALDERVGAQRGRVAHRVDLRQDGAPVEFGPFAGQVERLVETQCEVVVGGQRLRLDVLVVPDEEAVGEGAADVDGNSFHDYQISLGVNGCGRRP